MANLVGNALVKELLLSPQVQGAENNCLVTMQLQDKSLRRYYIQAEAPFESYITLLSCAMVNKLTINYWTMGENDGYITAVDVYVNG